MICKNNSFTSWFNVPADGYKRCFISNKPLKIYPDNGYTFYTESS